MLAQPVTRNDAVPQVIERAEKERRRRRGRCTLNQNSDPALSATNDGVNSSPNTMPDISRNKTPTACVQCESRAGPSWRNTTFPLMIGSVLLLSPATAKPRNGMRNTSHANLSNHSCASILDPFHLSSAIRSIGRPEGAFKRARTRSYWRVMTRFEAECCCRMARWHALGGLHRREMPPRRGVRAVSARFWKFTRRGGARDEARRHAQVRQLASFCVRREGAAGHFRARRDESRNGQVRRRAEGGQGMRASCRLQATRVGPRRRPAARPRRMCRKHLRVGRRSPSA